MKFKEGWHAPTGVERNFNCTEYTKFHEKRIVAAVNGYNAACAKCASRKSIVLPKLPPRLSATKLANKYLRDVFPDRDKLVKMFRDYARSRR